MNTLFQEVTDHHNQHGIEIRIWSLSEDNSQSWVRISHGSNKFVIDSNHNNTEIPADLPEEHASQLIAKDFAARSNAKAKPQKREPVDYLPSIIPINERKWIDIEPGESSFSAYEVSKKVVNLLRHCQTVQREDDGAVQFWRIKFIIGINFHKYNTGQTIVGYHAWQQEEDQKGDISTALTFQEQFFYFRALQGHSGRNLVDPSLQDYVIIQRGFFPSFDQQSEGEVVRQSRGEVQHATFSQLTQPIPKPICDRSGQPDNTQDVFVVKGETSRSHEIDEKGFHGGLCSSDRSGQPDNLSENTRVEQTHDGSGQPDERNSSSANTVKEQHAPEIYREIALLNTDNEFNRESTRRTSTSTFQDYRILQ